jgi:hypothetical protein
MLQSYVFFMKISTKDLHSLKVYPTFAPHFRGNAGLILLKGSLGEWLKPPVC